MFVNVDICSRNIVHKQQHRNHLHTIAKAILAFNEQIYSHKYTSDESYIYFARTFASAAFYDNRKSLCARCYSTRATAIAIHILDSLMDQRR